MDGLQRQIAVTIQLSTPVNSHHHCKPDYSGLHKLTINHTTNTPIKMTTTVTKEDFFNMSSEAQLSFKNENNAAYKALWAKNDKASTDLNYDAVKILTPKEYMQLNDSAKLDFKTKHPGRYAKLWNKDYQRVVAEALEEIDEESGKNKATDASLGYEASKIRSPKDYQRLNHQQQRDYKINHADAYHRLMFPNSGVKRVN